MSAAEQESGLILPKLHEVRQLAEAARWGLLDVVVLLDEIESEVMRASRERLTREMQSLDTLGLRANATAGEAEEYEPQDPISGDTA